MAVIDPMPNPRYSEVSEFEKDLIKKYLSKTLKKDLKDDIKIELVNSNFFYESYSIVLDNNKYLLKVNLNPDSKKLKTEFNCLKSVSDMISPKVIDCSIDKNTEIMSNILIFLIILSYIKIKVLLIY